MLYFDRIDVYEGIDINKKQVHRFSLIFVTIGIF